MAQKNANGTEKLCLWHKKMPMAQAPVWRRGDLMVTTDNQKRNRFVLYYIGIIFALYYLHCIGDFYKMVVCHHHHQHPS